MNTEIIHIHDLPLMNAVDASRANVTSRNGDHAVLLKDGTFAYFADSAVVVTDDMVAVCYLGNGNDDC